MERENLLRIVTLTYLCRSMVSRLSVPPHLARDNLPYPRLPVRRATRIFWCEGITLKPKHKAWLHYFKANEGRESCWWTRVSRWLLVSKTTLSYLEPITRSRCAFLFNMNALLIFFIPPAYHLNDVSSYLDHFSWICDNTGLKARNSCKELSAIKRRSSWLDHTERLRLSY